MAGRIVFAAGICAAAVWMLCAGNVNAAPISIANPSFESPETTFASPGATDWATDGPVKDPVFGFNPNTGVFRNPDAGPDPTTSGRIDNADGLQLAYIGSQTGNEFSQLLPAGYQPNQSY